MKKFVRGIFSSVAYFLFTITIFQNLSYPQDEIQSSYSHPIGHYSTKEMDDVLKGPIFGVETSSYGYEPAKYDVGLYKVRYITTNPYDGTADEEVSGLVAVPVNAPGPLPILMYLRSTEFARHAAPSSPSMLLEAKAAISVFAAHGYAVFMPDYIGKGDSNKRHTYLMASGEAQASFDMLLAGKSLCSKIGVELSPDIFISGWSQGGHSTMALLRMLEGKDYPGIKAAAPIAGPYDLYLNWCHWFLYKPADSIAAIMAYLVIAYQDYYPNLKGLEKIAEKPQYQDLAVKIFDTDDIPKDVFDQFGKTPRNLFEDKFIDIVFSGTDEFSKILRDNQVYMWKSDAPIRFYYGEADNIVPPVIAETAYNYMKSMGSDVSLVSAGPSAGHVGTFLFALKDSRKWFDELKKKL